VVITTPASNPTSSPTKIALVLFTAVVDLIGFPPQGNQIAKFPKNELLIKLGDFAAAGFFI